MRNRCLVATGALVALVAGTAVAAEADEENPGSGGSGLEEIVITAQKRPEKLQDVPVAAQVLSSQALGDADVADLSDLNKLVPSVELNGTINGRVPTAVRGISSASNEQTVGISSGVAISIDGVPLLPVMACKRPRRVVSHRQMVPAPVRMSRATPCPTRRSSSPHSAWSSVCRCRTIRTSGSWARPTATARARF